MNLLKLLRSSGADHSLSEQPVLLSPLQRLRQRTASDDAGFFVAEHDACAAAMTLARQWGERHRRGECAVVVASGGRFDDLIQSLSSDFCAVPFNDLSAISAAVDSKTVAIVLEPIQGQSVLTPASSAYVQGVAALCRQLNILLIFNEAQAGVGHSGGLLSEDTYGVRADIVVLRDHSNRSPRSSALLARGTACTTPIEGLRGCVVESASAPAPRSVSSLKPGRHSVVNALMA